MSTQTYLNLYHFDHVQSDWKNRLTRIRTLAILKEKRRFNIT